MMSHIYNLSTKFRSLFIFNKDKRHAFLERRKTKQIRINLENARPAHYIPVRDFNKLDVKSKSVLIVELNDFHGTTLPGFANYWSQAGYQCYFLLRYENFLERPLERLSIDYNAIVGDKSQLIKALKHKEFLNKFDFVFLNTTFVWPEPIQPVWALVGNFPKGKKGFFVVEHNLDPYVKMFREEDLIQNGQLFTLLGFRKTPMLFPDDIGSTSVHVKNKDLIKFICVGTIYPGNKNYSLLYDAIRAAVKAGRTNFKILIIGNGTLNDIPFDCQQYFELLGKTDYPTMYKAMEDADYYIPLLDPYNLEHHKYLNNWVTGSSIQIFGFLKPAIINYLFAKAYHLDSNNSIIYNNIYFKDAFIEAIDLSEEGYLKLVDGLNNTRNQLHDASLNILLQHIEKTNNYD